MNYREWLYDWLNSYIRTAAKQKTYACYRNIVELHIVPKLGEIELSNLTSFLLQNYIVELLKSGNLRTGKGLSPNSVNAIITVIKTSLRTAYSLGYINDEADKIIRPRITERRIECFSLSEQRKIEQYIIKKNKPRMIGILICLYSGLRIGELLALEWGDIDFSKGELLVNKTCYEGKGKSGIYLRSVDSPKTQSSIRTVPLPKQIVVLLKEVKKSSKSKYVVSNGEKFISIRSYQRSFSIIQKNLGISHRGFHALRHTFATRALECGMDVKTLSEIMGHKSATVTLNRYAHSCAEYKKEFMNRLGNNLFQKGQLSSN